MKTCPKQLIRLTEADVILLKMSRNCFENSCWNSQIRNLHLSIERLLQFETKNSSYIESVKTWKKYKKFS